MNDLSHGVAAIAGALSRGEAAISRGVTDQTFYELRGESTVLPVDDRGLYVEKNFKFREYLIKRQMDRLFEDSTGEKVIAGEYDDILSLVQGASPYVGVSSEEIWNYTNALGARFACEVYRKIFPIAHTLFLGKVL